jgi:hypothetical protein
MIYGEAESSNEARDRKRSSFNAGAGAANPLWFMTLKLLPWIYAVESH